MAFTLDLQSLPGALAVSGRVRHSETGAGIAGVLVSLAGQNTAMSGDGIFAFTGVSLVVGNMVTASKAGFLTANRTGAAPAGASLMTLSDMLLIPQPTTAKPVVTGIQAKYDGIFLSAASILNEYTASVNWNDGGPGSVEFYVNST